MQLIDAGMIAFAGWHALKGRVEWPLTFQVPRMLRALVREAEDTYALFWNAERLRKRERWPAYRDRPEIWDEAGREDFEAMLRVLGALGAVQYRTDGWEADEALAAVAHRLEGSEELVIRSDDKDFMQLLSGSTRMEGRVRGTVRAPDVEEILGVAPPFVADLLALAGDDADGIPRIVPPSDARRLLEKLGPVRSWIDRDPPGEDDPVDRALGRALEKREQLRLNLELVDLSRDAVGAPPEPVLEGRGELDGAREVGERTGIGWLADEDLDEEYAPLRRWGERSVERLTGDR